MRKALYALTAPVLAAAAAFSAPAGAAAQTIQPGVFAASEVGGCTLNFVYDGTGANAGKTYIGTAAHCVEQVGDQVWLDNGEVIGTIAYLGDQSTVGADFAFVEVKPELVGRVSAAVKGHPSYPTGVTTPQETDAGDDVQISGHGVGYDLTTTTQEKRTAILGYDDDAEYDVIGPIHWGDSGGPLVHIASGKALGIVSQLCLGTCTEMGPTVAGMIASAAENGFGVRLRTVG